MTENTPTPAELIAEARFAAEIWSEAPSLKVPADLAARLADALETVTAERDARDAVIEHVREAAHANRWLDVRVDNIQRILSTAPATVLAQRDARVLRAEAERLERMIGSSGPGNRASGYGKAGLDLLAQVRTEADRIERRAQR